MVSVRASTIDDRMTEHRDAIRSSEATILVVTPAGERSPLGPVWSDVMKHVAKKISWIDGFGITLNVFDEAEVAEQVRHAR